MTKRELKDHFIKMVQDGDIREVLADERFKKMSENFIDYPNAFVDVLKNRRHSTIVTMAVFFILK